MTSFEEFSRLSSEGNVIPVFETLPADTETAVSVYLKIKDESPFSFLLESVEGGEHLARYSFLGFNPFMKFTVVGTEFTVEAFRDDVTVLPSLASSQHSPVEALHAIFNHLHTVQVSGLPRLSGGAIGYFGYESVRLVENVPVPARDDLGIPDCLLLFYDVVLVFDNVRHGLSIVSNAYLPGQDRSEETLRREYDRAAAELGRVREMLRKEIPKAPVRTASDGEIEYVMKKEEYCRLVDRSKELIAGGDIFQVVLSQQLRRTVAVDPFHLYRSLRRLNPSPYLYYLQSPEVTIVGSSPEMLVRVEQGSVETRPIAGTRKRGRTAGEDAVLQQELLNDPKERAEHLMLVDLGRNDLGRVCRYGSVKVTQLMGVEQYSHVMHLVSSVRGTLREDRSSLDAFFSCFPAGTLTGAPKIRAIEIIAELEPVKRGVYGGAIAYIDFSGNLDSCIAIRTVVATPGKLYFQAGAGIVYDSVPTREYEETIEKLSATLKALENILV